MLSKWNINFSKRQSCWMSLALLSPVFKIFLPPKPVPRLSPSDAKHYSWIPLIGFLPSFFSQIFYNFFIVFNLFRISETRCLVHSQLLKSCAIGIPRFRFSSFIQMQVAFIGFFFREHREFYSFESISIVPQIMFNILN